MEKENILVRITSVASVAMATKKTPQNTGWIFLFDVIMLYLPGVVVCLDILLIVLGCSGSQLCAGDVCGYSVLPR